MKLPEGLNIGGIKPEGFTKKSILPTIPDDPKPNIPDDKDPKDQETSIIIQEIIYPSIENIIPDDKDPNDLDTEVIEIIYPTIDSVIPDDIDPDDLDSAPIEP